jgi:hypothetical protein
MTIFLCTSAPPVLFAPETGDYKELAVVELEHRYEVGFCAPKNRNVFILCDL